MSLYALGDLHLFSEDENFMDKYGRVWVRHKEKILKNCSKIVKDEDTIVFTGDNSFAKKINRCFDDMDFIKSLPGRKILIRGNHDRYWESKKTDRLNDTFKGELNFLQNNFYTYEDYALVGTKGFTFEGPFYLDRFGNIIDVDRDALEHSKVLIKREEERLRCSFDKAVEAGYNKFIMFLHYPPTNILETESIFTQIAKEYGVSHVVYSHSHGKPRFHDSIIGEYEGVNYHLVSGDYLNFKPEKIL